MRSRRRETAAEHSPTAGYVDIHAHGGELSLEMALEVGDAELKQASLDQRGTDLLIETPENATAIDDRLSRLRARGYRITLTHPDRCAQFQAEPEHLEGLADRGVLLALDAESLLGPAGSRPRLLAERLCRGGHAHALAFDAASGREPAELAGPESAASALVGRARARWLVSDAPDAIVAGRDLPPMPAAHTGLDDGSGQARRPERTDPPLPVAVRLSRAVVVIPLVAVAIVSFVIVRAQHGTGATILAQQRYSQRLTASNVALAVRAAPDPTSHQAAIRVRCVPHGAGGLRNPWRCQLTYANRDRMQYTVTIAGNGSYVGTDHILLGPGPRRSAGGSISGCCITIP
jgi:hypothetical protein